jgi:ribosomal protein L3
MDNNTATAPLSIGAPCIVKATGYLGVVDRFGFNTETGMADRSQVRVKIGAFDYEWHAADEVQRVTITTLPTK